MTIMSFALCGRLKLTDFLLKKLREQHDVRAPSRDRRARTLV